jgi:hypothetical protein
MKETVKETLGVKVVELLQKKSVCTTPPLS